MEHPVKEIPEVIAALTKGEPEEQEGAISNFFLPNASFSHPFCHVPSFSKSGKPLASGVDWLWVILAVYRWYRTLNPHIDLKVESSEFDEKSGLLYVSLRQTFSLWFIPLYKAPARLVSVLQLTQCNVNEHLAQHDPSEPLHPEKTRPRLRYFIASQEDLYLVNDSLRFLLPGLGPALFFMWQLYTAWLCVVGSVILLPLFQSQRKLRDRVDHVLRAVDHLGGRKATDLSTRLLGMVASVQGGTAASHDHSGSAHGM
ncbi:hypothetical protein NLU13_2537 [Sarocladium strictum]|uniref:SigF-like NTF2-like domain-containing protein n=1 Tax=Sarocladium strictum TaxID=5046 RepID=A0AA39GKC2_SARSR|nr:hypothetical protein NLU13_2537 [Sarocladium strictum]